MSKQILVDAMAAKAGLTKAQAGDAFDAIVETITAKVKAKEKLTIPGVLSLDVKHQAAKTGRNPATGAELQIPAKNVVKIKAAKALGDAAN